MTARTADPQNLKSSNSSIDLVVFDLDGTLVDSRRDIAESANALLAECGAGPLSEDAVGGMVGDGAALLVVRLFAAVGQAPPADALSRFLAIYDARLLVHTHPYDGMVDVLSELSGHLALAVLTNKPLGATRRILAGLDLSRFFAADRVLGGDGPLARKPDPAGLLALAAAANVPPSNSVLVGDSMVDWRTAQAAGARCCLARYGYGFRGLASLELMLDAAFIDTPRDLPAVLSRFGTVR